MIVSVVIPTYFRGQTLSATINHLLASRTNGLERVEIVVVDDGSPVPAEPIVASATVRPPFTLCCIRQENAGPAAARNRGYRETVGSIVLFVDDDIRCPPDLIQDHVAAHRRNPGSVIVGRCPLVAPQLPTQLFDFVNSLGNDAGAHAVEEFVRIPVIASGQISFERSMFAPGEAIYRDDLATPAAEEYELSLRLRDRNIPILLATRIEAAHDHPVTLRSMCHQAFKHGKGCAEAIQKCPRTLLLDEVATILRANSPISSKDRPGLVVKKLFRQLVSMTPMRQILFGLATFGEPILGPIGLLPPMYRTALGSSFLRGVRAGLVQYAPEPVASVVRPPVAVNHS